MKRIVACTLFVLLGVLPWTAFAQSLFDYQLKTKVQTDQGAPVLILRANEFIAKGTVTITRSDGDVRRTRLGKMQPAQEKRIAFKIPKNRTFKFKVEITGESQFNQTMNTAFETEVTWVDPIKLHVDRQKVQVGEGRLILASNVPLDRVDIEVFDNDGNKFVERTQAIGGKAGELEIEWPAKKPEVGAIRLKAHDMAGFWNAVVLEPFWVEIPHEEVIFHFGKASWDDAETPKLKETLTHIRKAMKKHAHKGLDMQLYIAGYTDTVGSHAENMKLSQARAKAIASWFRKSGLEVSIYYQGFGESVLAKQTPDNTPEPANRRALYILGNSPPPTSAQIPRNRWKKL